MKQGLYFILTSICILPSLNGQISFEKQVVYEGAPVHSAQAADYNGDGLKDLIFSADGGVNLALSPDFEVYQIHSLPKPFQEACIHSNIMDVDGDGDMDFLGENGGIYWLECPNHQVKTKSWNLHWITREFTGTHCIALHDVNADGQQDIIVNNFFPPGHDIEKTWPNQYPNSIIWFSVPDDPRNENAWRPHLIADGDAVGGSHYIGFADINGDSQDECLAGAKGDPFEGGNHYAYWTMGDKVTDPWKKTMLDHQTGATHIYGSDFNQDGQTDMIASNGHGYGLVYYEAPEFEPEIIDPELYRPHAFTIADIENDGDVDLFVCAKGSKVAKWHENNGKGEFTGHHLTDDQQAYDIFICDLENDGDLDIIIAGHLSENIVLFRQKDNP